MIELYCSECGGLLNVEIGVRKVTVLPCSCQKDEINEAYDQGREEGYNEGKLDGFEEARQ